jgi:hypothetical protein
VSAPALPDGSGRPSFYSRREARDGKLADRILADPGADALNSTIAALATARALGDIAAGHGIGDRIEGRVYFEV